MTKDYKKTIPETEFCFALALLLTNVSVLTALFAMAWLLYSLIVQADFVFSFGNAFPKS